MNRNLPPPERFWPKVNKETVTGCWEWTASTTKFGYGNIHRGGKKTDLALAHRVSFEYVNGPIPAGLSVLHCCDNPRCVNPAHLFLGTKKENSADMVRKGRSSAGERNGQAKLKEADVFEIKRLISAGEFGMRIAKRFGVSPGLIRLIKTKKVWAHIA